MRLQRIRLRNFRGVVDAEVVFATEGVTVVHGPNEVGKSSIPEALRLVRAFYDSSKAGDVTRVQPVGVDAGPEVEVELTTGGYHVTYAKRFLRRAYTELTVHAPRREHLSGRDAHDRYKAIFEETLDTQLWDALQVTQGAAFELPVLARIEPLLTALSADDGGGGHQDLMSAVETEFLRYFTAKGRVTGPLRDAECELEETRTLLKDLDDRQREADDLVDRHEAADARYVDLGEQVAASAAKLATLQECRRQVETVRRQVEEVGRAHASARERVAAIRREADDRAEILAEVDARIAECATLRSELESATDRRDRHQVTMRATGAESDAAEAFGREQGEALRGARRTLEQARQAHDLRTVERRVADGTAAHEERERARAYLRTHHVDERRMQEISAAETEVRTSRATREAAAARVEVERLGDVPVVAAGEPVEGSVDLAVLSEVDVRVEGVVRVRVRPGQDLGDLDARVREAEGHLTRVLADSEVETVEAARRQLSRRTDLEREAARAEAVLAQVLGDEELAEVVRTRDELRARLDDHDTLFPEPTDLGDLQCRVEAAEEAVEQAERLVSGARAADVEATREQSVLHQKVLTLQTELESSHRALDGASERLARRRAERSDDALARESEEAGAALDAAAGRLREAEDDLGAARPDDLEVELEAATAARTRLEQDRRDCEDERNKIAGRLEQIGEQGLADSRGECRARLADLEREHGRLEARASAARMLKETLERHRAEVQERYVGPFRAAVEGLGSVVLGDGFSVEVSPDLEVTSVTRAGTTVPFASLSGGAKEQLAIIARLACAQLVDTDEGAPVILDDVLGFADPTRLRRMAAVVRTVGRTAQVVVLTCQPDRTAEIADATLVALRSDAS